MRNQAWHGNIEDLDTAEDKKKKDCRDPQEHHADQSQDANLFGLGTIERWQPDEQQQSTDHKDDVRRDSSCATEAIWTRKKKDEQTRTGRTESTDQQELAVQQDGH